MMIKPLFNAHIRTMLAHKQWLAHVALRNAVLASADAVTVAKFKEAYEAARDEFRLESSILGIQDLQASVPDVSRMFK